MEFVLTGRVLTTSAARSLLSTVPCAGTIGVLVRPACRRDVWVARDLLVATGARFTGLREGESADALWNVFAARLTTMAITDVVIVGVAHLDSSALEQLHGRLVNLPGRCWLIGDGTLPQRVIDCLEPHGINPADNGNVPLPAPVPAAPPTTQPQFSLGRLPRSDFPTFAADCRRLLGPEDATVALDRLQHYRKQLAAAWPARQTPQALLDLVLTRLRHCPDPAMATLLLRASQLEAFKRGVHIQFLPARLHAGLAHIALPVPTPAQWQRLWQWVLPWKAAACVLFAAGLTPQQLAELRLSDVTCDDTVAAIAGRKITLTGPPAKLITAQHRFRLACGATPNLPLLAEDDTPRNRRSLADVAGQAALEHGVQVTHPRVARAKSTTLALSRHIGLAVSVLTKDDR